MFNIIEIISEIILDGAIEAAGSKKIPMFLRILLAAVVLLFAAGLCILLFTAGKETENTGLIALSILLVIAFAFTVILKVKKRN